MSNKILDYTEENGLVFCHDVEKAKNNAEILYISEVKKMKAHAVFFRRFFNNNDNPYHSEPAVCIFKEEDIPFNSDEHVKLHASLWSAGKNEVYIIVGKTRINIINSRKPAGIDNDRKPYITDDLILASNAVKAFNESSFSAYLFGSGTFWEQTEYESQLNEKNSPYNFLLDYLMRVRKELIKSQDLELSPSTIDKLLVICILVKFLEDIQDDDGVHTLQDIYKKYHVLTFAEAIDKGLCVNILNDLANEFNGKIFDKFTTDEKEKISKTSLTLISQFLNAKSNLVTGQLFIWEQYSFKYLPAEVISAIYENFIQEEAKRANNQPEKGVVYTPIHLVNFLIDEVMPLNKADLFSNGKFKILDPSCGSGVFLVAAYKRLLQWWAINNSSPDNIQYPDSETAQKILEDNIFGVDVKEMAVLVSIFGLTTALLDKLTPKQIWNKLKFKDLSRKNIQKKNFFTWALEAKNNGEYFDLVIGNPPFNVETGSSKEEVLQPDLLKALELKHKDIPNNNFALHFFEASMVLAKKSCLIIPSNVLLYNKSNTANQYRTDLYTDFTVSKIFDFTHLRRILFHKTADTPVVALITENKPSNYQSIEHIVIKRMISTEKNIRFEIDDYDRHLVRWNWAVDESKQFVWKTNLLGGGRLFHLIYRLSLLDNLKQFTKKEGWSYNIGYIQKHAKKQPIKCDFITGKKSIVPNSFDATGKYLTTIQKESYFVETRNVELYQPPLIVFKLVIEDSSIPMAFVNEYLCFNSSFVGISAPKQDEKQLYQIYNRLFRNEITSRLLRAYILTTSSKAIVYHETSIVKEDIDSLPFPGNEEFLNTSSSESIIIDDVLIYYRHLGKSISPKSDGAILHKKVNKAQLKEYGTVFCKTLNEIYAKNGKSWQLGTVYQTALYTVTQIGFGTNDELKFTYSVDLDENIQYLINNEIQNKAAIYKRVIRIYKHINGFDCIFFIKPHALRYWLKSIALRDADNTFIELKKEGF